MNFKKLTMIAVLAASQTALVLPAGAETAVQVQQNAGTVQGVDNAAASAVTNNITSSTTNTGNSSNSGAAGTDGTKGTAGTSSTTGTSGNAGGTNGTTGTESGTSTTTTTSGQDSTGSGTAGTTGNTGNTGNTGQGADQNGGTTDGTSTSGQTDGSTGNTNDGGKAAEGQNAGAQGNEGQSEGTAGGTATTTDPQGITATGSTTTGQAGQLILMMNSNKMYQDGKLYLAGQPMAVKNGVSYVAIRAMVERVGLKLTYDAKTKETIIIKDNNELRFKTNSSSYRVNGVAKPMKGPAYQYKNTFMVPLTSITQALGIPYTVDQPGKRVILNLSTKPVATFSVGPTEIFAGETTVNYISQATSPSGLPIIDERWEGKEDIFQEPGLHTVTHYVQDSSGQWSDPYSITVNVLKPNEPPVASFTTDKEQYKMGELITITDQSTDDEDAIVSREWLNDRKAFFQPGPQTIRLKVTDKHGAISEFQKTVVITNETLYTEDEFNKLFTPVGDKFTFNGGSVPSWKTATFTTTSDPATLIRSNSPETVYSEGLLYQETALGSTRFMLHHVNATNKNMQVYVIATNTMLDMSSTINIQNFGMGGPSPYATGHGRASVMRYFDSMTSGSGRQDITLAPGESKVIMTNINNIKMKPGEGISVLADAFSNYPVKYSVIMLDATKDPLQSLPFLPALDRDVHNRGTYPNSVVNMSTDEVLGSTETRIVLGDNNIDPNLKGLDGIYGTEASNAGNFGVLYKIKLNHVAPNTLITLNPRGGVYNGIFLVNGQQVQAANNTQDVNAPNETSVLYRTGNYEQSVEIWYTAAPGSNLPINLLLMPMPQMKQ
ncbi:stalk domain-containing protein [Paenibacillus cellulositrophicus]|uniref:copper amine oxidase N-terminal domain-containing protein n=1 Tax=Paenibacillus cellulositrophicus TaxID=562959 RepID=UPI003F7F2692